MWRKCGKPNCACAQPGHRGHGPQYNLTRRIGGKTVNVHLKPGPELEKAEREVAEHQRFAALVEEVSQVSEAICAARPVTAGTAPPPAGRGKGGLAARLEEIAAAEVGRLAGLAAGMLGAGAALGVLEQAMRAALATAGRGAAGGGAGRARTGTPARAPGAAAAGRPSTRAVRDKTVTTVLGPVTLQRGPGITARRCKHGFAPRDQQLGMRAGGSLSPGLAEMTALAGAEVSFARAAGLLAGLAGITVSPRTIERSAEASGAAARAARRSRGRRDPRPARSSRCPRPSRSPTCSTSETDGTGVPVRASETEGRQGKGEDGKAGTREVKLARLFTVSRLDDGRQAGDGPRLLHLRGHLRRQGRPRRAGEGRVPAPRRRAPPPGRRPRRRRRLDLDHGRDLYPHATHIVDIYHAREHLHDLAAHLAFITPDPPQWLARPQRRARRRQHQRHHRRRPQPTRSTASRPSDLDKKLGYFERNAHRMRYQHFRDLGMFTGSGAIEGGIKAIVVQRAKQSGMHWTVEGAADIIALRCQHASGRWDELWPARAHPAGPGLRAAI